MRLSLQPFVDEAFQVILQILGRIGPKDMTNREYINIAILTLSKYFFGDVLTCVSVLLENKKDPHIRCAALTLLRIILSQNKYLKVLLQTFLKDIVAIVKLAIGLQEEVVVRRAVVDCIAEIRMSEADFSSVVGFHNILSYLIPSASINETSSDALLNVRDAACNGLMLPTSSNGILDRQLWPFIIEHIREYPVHPSLLGAFCTVCNNIVPPVNRVSEHSSYFYVDFSKAVNVPPPGMIAVVFLSQSMLIGFHRAEDLFTVLEASLSIAPLLDDPFSQPLGEKDECSVMPIAELWSTSIPHLQKFFATEPTRENWEAEVERLLDKTLKVKQSEEWAMQFVSESLKLLQAYQGNSHMMRSGLIFL
ncbi:hypothetical protein LSM04_003988 [Trypanosoma melophagium]|uniref:uncharacterized protein n=1 Tax=Trypanosoma melophagium TaxID=715481 RepID=UPI00351A79A0|nr:hypothetical protein LSM04_003988 [Trypanosoma melophagium]